MGEIILFFLPALFFICELIFFLFSGQRFWGFPRILFEITTLIIFPYLYLYILKGFKDIVDFTNLPIAVIILILILLCIAAYFITSYKKHSFSVRIEKTLNLFLFIGIIINVGITVTLLVISNMDDLALLLSTIGNLPIVIAYITTLCYNIKGKKNPQFFLF